MARNIRIVNARDFVSAKPDGVLDLEESEKILRDVVASRERHSGIWFSGSVPA